MLTYVTTIIMAFKYPLNSNTNIGIICNWCTYVLVLFLLILAKINVLSFI